MANAKYTIHSFGRQGICPVCAGTLVVSGNSTNFRCVDCSSGFKVVDEGMTDMEVVCECTSINE